MRKVCPQCGGRGTVMVRIEGFPIDGVACLNCNKTGYIDVPEGSNDKGEETSKTDNL